MRLAPLLVLAAASLASAGPDSVESMRRDVQRALKLRTASEQASALDAACQGRDSAEAADVLVDLVFDHDAPQIVLNTAVHALGRMAAEGVVGVLRKAAESGALLRRTRAIEALGRSAAAGSGVPLRPLTFAPEPAIRAAAITALGSKGEEASVGTVETSLADADWTVRSAAISALARLASRHSVPVLCDAMRASDGRLVDDCAAALRAITGQRFGADPARYEAWWRKEEKAELPPSPAWKAPPLSFDSAVLGTRSRRILFVLSTSDTMKDPVSGAIDDDEVVKCVRLAGQDLADDLKAAKTKLDVARVHLRAILRTLADGVEFDVMTYSGSPNFAFGKLTAADANTRKRAETRVASLSPGGPANLHGALVRLYDPRGKDPLTAEDGPDTVILFSDGPLAEPGSRDVVEVGASAMRWNAVRQIKFLVVETGLSDDAVLGRLASGPPQGASLKLP
jgi:hypothetical protein